MNIVVVVEGRFDMDFLRILIEDLRGRQYVRWVVANGKDAARQLARRYILDGVGAILLVVDADVVSDEMIDAQKSDIDAYLRWSGGEYPSAAVLFKPEIEEVFFSSKEFVSRVFKNEELDVVKKMSPLSPRETLKLFAVFDFNSNFEKFSSERLLFPGTRREMFLTKNEIKEMRKHPGIVQIRNFIKNNYLLGMR